MARKKQSRKQRKTPAVQTLKILNYTNIYNSLIDICVKIKL